METEISKWDEKGVVTPVEWSKEMPKVIDLLWRFQEKVDAVGGLVKRKARCVAKGFKMVLGEHSSGKSQNGHSYAVRSIGLDRAQRTS
ncbi:hypothetical protein CPC08DRAFT_755101 [Agrocybe pediades]|nr:hypothetical protein CPC08DRAFT_755101 [Agrocybe pediades]